MICRWKLINVRRLTTCWWGILFAFGIVIALATPACATIDTVYVSNTASCSPSSGCGSGTLANPYNKIQYAITQIGSSASDKVLAVMGTGQDYTEPVSISHGGTSGHPFVFFARGDSVTITGATTVSAWTSETCSGATLWKVTSPPSDWNSTALVVANYHRYTLCDSCTSCGDLGQSWRVGKFWKSSSTVYVNFGSGTYSSQVAYLNTRDPLKITASYVTVRGFKIVRGRFDNIQVNTGTPDISDVIVQNCTVQECRDQGIDVRNISNATIKSNSVSACNNFGIFVHGTASACVIQDNVSFANDNQQVFRSGANGFRIGSGGTATTGNHIIERNKAYLNEDSGFEVNGSRDNVFRYNQSWKNGDHGFDHNDASTGTIHLGDLAFGNDRDGFSVEGGSTPSTNVTVKNCVFVDNGRATDRKDYEMEILATSGFTSDYNLIQRPSGRTANCASGVGEDGDNIIVNLGVDNIDTQSSGCPSTHPCADTTKCFPTVAQYVLHGGGLDAHSQAGDPDFVSPEPTNVADANFRPNINSKLIDAADSGPTNWLS